MTCVACVISIFLTVLVPLKLTYDTYKAKSADIKLWAIYWACFTLVTGLFWLAPFLSNSPFVYIFVAVLVWLYHETFKGALFLDEQIRHVLANNQAVASTINTIAEKIHFLHLFEGSKPVDKTKTA